MANVAFKPPSGAIVEDTAPSKPVAFKPPSDAIVEDVTSNKPEDSTPPDTKSKFPVRSPLFTDAAKAGGEAFVRGLPATGGFWAGAGAGAALAAPVAATVAPMLPAGPIVAGALEFGGAVLFGLIGSGAVESAVEKLNSIMDPVGYEKWKETQKQHPVATGVGSFASGFAGSSYKTAAQVAGKVWTKPIVQRGVAGTLMGVMDVGQQLVHTGTVDPKMTAAAVAGGIALPGANVAGRLAQGIGESTVKGIKRLITGTKETPAKKEVEIPPEYVTPEQKSEFLTGLKKKVADKAPLVEAAIRNKETGEVERMGAKHDPKRKEETKDTHEEGFVDSQNVFHERQAAVDQAKRAGQLPEDHVLENPPGERPGLHSGDLRNSGNAAFQLETKAPLTRDDFKKSLDSLDYELAMTLPIDVQEAKVRGDVEGLKELEAKQTKLEQDRKDLIKQMPKVEFKDPLKPTWAELKEHLHGSRTLGESFDRILDSNVGYKSQRILLKALNQSEFIRNAGLGFDSNYIEYVDSKGNTKKDASGIYNFNNHTVTVGKDGDIRTLIHESVHAGTHRLIEAGKSAAALKIKELYETYLEKHNIEYEVKLEEFKKTNPTLEQLTKFENENVPYGSTDVHEFIAEAFGSNTFKEILSKIKTTSPEGVISNLLREFRDAVRRGLNLPESQRTLLDEVFEQGSSLIEESKGFKPKEEYSGSSGVVASRMSQEIHDQLEREGIAIAHSSPHKFGQFNWIKYALSGEGHNAFGAGTYGSQADSTNTFYIRKSKDVLRDKVYEEDSKVKAESNRLMDNFFDAQEAHRNNRHNLEKFQANVLQEAKYEFFKTFKDYLEDSNKVYSEETKLEYNKYHEDKSRKYGRVLKQETALKDNVKVTENKLIDKQKKLKDFQSKVDEQLKAPTYHSTFNAKPEELLDWNATKQSDLVNKAFEKLGIDLQEEKLQWALKDLNQKDRYSAIDSEGRELFLGREDSGIFGSDGWNIIDVNTGEILKRTFTLEEILNTDKTGEQLYRELSKKFEPQDEATRNEITDREAEQIGQAKASIALAEQGVVGNVHDAQGGTEKEFRNYVVFDDTKITQNYVSLASRASKDSVIKEDSTLPEGVKEEAKGIDVRSISNVEEFNKHAEAIYVSQGEKAAVDFFTAWKEHQVKAAIPVPENIKDLADTLHKIDTWETADSSEFRVKHENNTKEGVTPEMREQLFRAREGEIPMTPELKALQERLLADGDRETVALIEKARKLTGDERTLREFETGQARYRLFSPRERSWKDFWKRNSPMGDKIAEEASATKERTIFQLEDGTVVQIQRNEKTGSTKVFKWEKNEKKPWVTINMGDKRLSAGDTLPIGKGIKITDGQVHNIEANTPYRYLKDAEATQYMKLIELRKMTRDLELIDNLKKSDFMKAGRGPDVPLHEIPKDYVVPNNIDKIPQLRGWSFDPKTSAVIEDFAKVWDDSLMTKLSGQLIKNMMLNPFPHMMNEVAHLWNLRGLSGWVLPGKIADLAITGKRAFNDVATQSPFYRELMREGGTPLGADPRNNAYWDSIGRSSIDQMKNIPGITNMLKGLGYKTLDLYNAWSKNSAKAMWFTRDVMYVQAVHEIMDLAKRRGEPIDTKEAIRRVEMHMPNYRIPTEVLNSRGLSKVLQNPNISIFARYHYGLLRSMGNILKEINPKNLATIEGRQEFKQGIDSALAAAVAMTIVYPMLDVVAEQVFGPDSKLRRAGPFHLIHAMEKVATGDRDASALVWPIFTFNPVLLTLGQLVFNKNIFTGKPIYHPEDTPTEMAGDVGIYLAKSVPQIATGLKAQSEGDMTSTVAKQFDVQTESDKQKKRIELSKKRREAQRKGRETKRAKGTYEP